MTLLNPDADEHSAELARARRRRNRAILTLLSGIVAALVLFEGFFVLRDSQAPKLVTALFAMVWGGGGTAILYLIVNQLIEFTSSKWQQTSGSLSLPSGSCGSRPLL